MRADEGDRVEGFAQRQYVVPVFEKDDCLLFHAVQEFARFGRAEGRQIVFVRVWICDRILRGAFVQGRRLHTFEQSESELGTEHRLYGLVDVLDVNGASSNLVCIRVVSMTEKP